MRVRKYPQRGGKSVRNDLPEVIVGTPPVLLSVQALPFERVALESTGLSKFTLNLKVVNPPLAPGLYRGLFIFPLHKLKKCVII